MLEKDQILKTVQAPLNSFEIQEGRDYESELRLYTESKDENAITSETAWLGYLSSLNRRISVTKRDRITDFIVFPLAVTSISQKLCSDLYRVFSSQDKHFEHTTLKAAGGDEIEKSLKEANLSGWIEEEGRKVIKNKPCSIVVVDVDENGVAYPIHVDSDRIVDFKLTQDKKSFEYISFIHSVSVSEDGKIETRYGVYDDVNYNVVYEKDGNYDIEKSIPHKIGYCPARFFIDEVLNSSSDYKRYNRFYPVLSKLEQWQTITIFKYYTEHHVPYPKTEMVRGYCGDGNCKAGKLTKYKESGESYIVDCPECSDMNNLSVGTIILLEPQEDKEETTAAGIFKEHYPEVKCLEYLDGDLEAIESFIADKVTGNGAESNKSAINEDQVKSDVESRKNVYLDLKKNLDSLYVWIAETIAFASSPNAKINVFADWGAEWYLFSEEDLLKRYQEAKEKGLMKSELDSLFLEYLSTKYKGDTQKAQKEKILFYLNPDPHSNTDQKIIKLSNGLISREDAILSENLTEFVRLFELESKTNILDFGSDLEFGSKIKLLKEKLKTITKKYKTDGPIEKNDPE